MRREIKDSVRKQHNLYVNNLVGDVKANPRDFYRYINSQKKDSQGIPPLKRRRGTGITASEIEQAEQFNGQFTDMFNKGDHSEVPFLSRSAPFMDDVVSNEVVTKLLKGLNPSKVLGPDELQPRDLKDLQLNWVQFLPISSKSLLTWVKSPKNGLLQICVPSIKRVTGLSHVIIVPSHLLVYLASYSNR